MENMQSIENGAAAAVQAADHQARGEQQSIADVLDGLARDIDSYVSKLDAAATAGTDPPQAEDRPGTAAGQAGQGQPEAAPDSQTRLAPNHAKLIEDSAVSPEVAIERGYFTAKTKAELKRLNFADYQQRPPALVIPIYGVTGEIVNYQIRPDSPYIPKSKNGKRAKP